MQKNAWTYTMAGTVFAAVAVMLHWLQVQKIFDPETGLPTLHAPITTLLVVVLVLVAAALWWLSGRMKTDCAPEEPEDALALPHRETGWILIAAAALAALGSAYLFFKEDSTLMKAAALLGILSAPVLAMMPQIPRWGGFGAAWRGRKDTRSAGTLREGTSQWQGSLYRTTRGSGSRRFPYRTPRATDRKTAPAAR